MVRGGDRQFKGLAGGQQPRVLICRQFCFLIFALLPRYEADEKTMEHRMTHPPEGTMKIRGGTYLDDKVKIEAKPAAFRLFDVKNYV